MKYIELPAGKKARIRRALGVSCVTLWSVLTIQTQSALAEKIRRMALQDGGRVMSEVDVTSGFMPNCETDFVHGDGGVQRIIQTFSNGVRVVFDNDACTAIILHNEKPVKNYEQVVIRDWGDIVSEMPRHSDLFTTICCPIASIC